MYDLNNIVLPHRRVARFDSGGTTPDPNQNLSPQAELAQGDSTLKEAMYSMGTQMLGAASTAVQQKSAIGQSEGAGAAAANSALSAMANSGSPYMAAASLAISGLSNIGSKAKSIDRSDAMDQAASSYAATSKSVDDAINKSQKKYAFGIGKRKANKAIDEANRQQKVIGNIMSEANQDRQRQALASEGLAHRNDQELSGGFNAALVRAAKKGGTIGGIELKSTTVPLKERLDVLKPYDETKLVPLDEPVENVTAFQNGGEMNLIPEGALHARLHNIETEEKITKKGIPVIDIDGQQQAEIECNEIVFRLEATKKLDEMRNSFNETEDKDKRSELAIECGKLLVQEILYNTEDRTGLIRHTK